MFVFDIVENRCFRSQWPWPLDCDKVFYIWELKYRMMSIFIPCLVSSVLKMWEWQAIILHRNKEEKHFNDLWWPWPLTLGYEIFRQYFQLCYPLCMHKLNRHWSFLLDQNYLETPKVMTLTFDLENVKWPYKIKLECILYLNAKFDGYILKTL